MKRKRGGQPGNHNARTHGFYSGDLTPTQLSQFWQLVSGNKLSPQEALMRVKLGAVGEQRTVNPRILKDAARLSAKWKGANLHLSKADTNYLRKIIYAVLEKRMAVTPPEADK